jgi:hypothetical protein
MGNQVKTCLLFPHLTVDFKMKRVYPSARLPYPGPNCDCDSCHTQWMESLEQYVRGKA